MGASLELLPLHRGAPTDPPSDSLETVLALFFVENDRFDIWSSSSQLISATYVGQRTVT